MSSLIDRDWLKNIVHGMILLILASTIISILTMTISAIPDESMSVDIDGDGNPDFNMKVVLQLMSVFVPIAIIVTALNKLGVRFALFIPILVTIQLYGVIVWLEDMLNVL